MKTNQYMRIISLNAHAKVNLSLEITGRRPDGYHEIVSFMQGIGVHDIIRLELCPQNATKYNLPRCTINGIIVYLCTDADTIPADLNNLALQGVKAVTDAFCKRSEATEISGQELLVVLRKRLPVAAGIAGGSGNAAACMLGMNALLGCPFGLRELMSLGVEVGADVPFSIFMNAWRNRERLADLDGIEEAADSAWIEGIGDIVSRADPIPRYVILANPGSGVSTKAAYEAIDNDDCTQSGKLRKGLFVNELESYTLGKYKGAAGLKELMSERLDADELLMSGSGPTIVAYYKDKRKAESDMEVLSSLTRGMSGVRIWLSDSGI